MLTLIFIISRPGTFSTRDQNKLTLKHVCWEEKERSFLITISPNTTRKWWIIILFIHHIKMHEKKKEKIPINYQTKTHCCCKKAPLSARWQVSDIADEKELKASWSVRKCRWWGSHRGWRILNLVSEKRNQNRRVHVFMIENMKERVFFKIRRVHVRRGIKIVEFMCSWFERKRVRIQRRDSSFSCEKWML